MARTIRLSWPPAVAEEEPGVEIFLTPGQARHGVLVLRLKPGSVVEMAGPAGLAPALVTTASVTGLYSRKNPGLGVTLTGPWAKPETVSGPRLALALIQAGRFDWAVEKVVELGAAILIPLITERVKAADARPGPARTERWLRLAEEARKQCGRSRALEIFPALTLPELLKQPGPAFFLSPKGLPAGPGPIASPLLAIGPEGGFSPAEEMAFLAAGFQPWSLGGAVLRAETAALAALARLSGTLA